MNTPLAPPIYTDLDRRRLEHMKVVLESQKVSHIYYLDIQFKTSEQIDKFLTTHEFIIPRANTRTIAAPVFLTLTPTQ